MSLTIYFAKPALFPKYEPHLKAGLERLGIDAKIVSDISDPTDVDYIIFANGGDISDFRPFTRAKAVLNLWAGVEKFITNPTLNLPVCRMVDPALSAGMVEWVTGHVLRHHLGMDRYIVNPDRVWDPTCPPLASERPVTILGMGELGQACGKMLSALGFPVTGWSRNPREVAGIRTLSGDDGLAQALSEAAIVVTLLPLTPATEGLLNAERLALLPKGAVIINPGRGALIDDQALLQALDRGAVGHATLDVFRIEPLPDDHPYWIHPNVTVTPHIAAETRPNTASEVIVENIRRGEAGEPFLHLVDIARGY